MSQANFSDRSLPLRDTHSAGESSLHTSTEYAHLSDELLMVAVKQGDQTALSQLYDRHAALMLGVALKILGDRNLAEEILQEAFWRIWRSAEQFQHHQGRFIGWAARITRNLAIDYLRKGHPPAISIDDTDSRSGLHEQADPGHSTSDLAWHAIKHTHVRRALADLPPDQRQVIELAFFWGLSRQEIAHRIQVPLGTVHTRARLALKKLRHILSTHGIEE